MRNKNCKVVVSKEALSICQDSRNQITKWLEKDAPVVYGVNTGLGNLKDTVLSPDDHLKWNKTIPYPHAVGFGDPIDPIITRLALLLRTNVLSRGYSAVRPELINRMLDIFNAGISPVVLELGSTGLSDLGPLSQSAMVVAGLEEAEVFHKNSRKKAQDCFIEVGLPPTFELECKEVLSQMNGSTMTQAIAVLAYHSLQSLFELQNNIERKIDIDMLNTLTSRTSIYYACEKSMKFVNGILNFENNITCDNPLLFKIEEGSYEPVMGCNCSNTQVGYVMDLLNMIAHEKAVFLVKIIELMSVNTQELSFINHLIHGISNELKGLCMPASADSIPTKGNQEDHVEFSYGAARKASKAAELYKKLVSSFIYVWLFKERPSLNLENSFEREINTLIIKVELEKTKEGKFQAIQDGCQTFLL